MPSQQVIIGPALMEGVERTNAMMVRGQGQGTNTPRRDFYAMEVDRRRNCYACGRFGHMAYRCRNQERERVADGRRLEYGEERKGPYKHLNHLKEEENLEFLD